MKKLYDDLVGDLGLDPVAAGRRGTGIPNDIGSLTTVFLNWPRVPQLYDDLVGDLGLDPAQVPLLAGELVATEQGGKCGGMNDIIGIRLWLRPQHLP